ncbi:CIA30 family protein [Rhodoferax antarcticus]|uniref:Complex I intermediate-associated 30 family protein n=1 Tax=Rhodoferax antarcticus ANT.BR TaxID=1111071 RepID=A0A1Q8YF68_9BURK|nr:CIA30 family protein [Rhodoferax antarcticus]APW46390.1 hypothetical protein RA876_08380 [Rhodoferax antarcticus]MCW2314013.1 hypothetical protein [Rhodoferax antarcticus]OLP06632.1 complex I intermediate-associated 30 family protein [Rhodoferax antarcticus ANT.BR]
MANLIELFDNPSSVRDWQPINDRVMGGVSSSQMRFDPAGHAVLAGVVSLLNNGGFASVRAQLLRLGGPGTTAYCITAWGDGNTYKLNLRTASGFDELSYQASFTPATGQWSQTELPLAKFLPTFHGRVLPDVPPLQPTLVTQLGLMISDRQAGPFRLLLKSIEAVGADA